MKRSRPRGQSIRPARKRLAKQHVPDPVELVTV
jgi:hypothetical protein